MPAERDGERRRGCAQRLSVAVNPLPRGRFRGEPPAVPRKVRTCATVPRVPDFRAFRGRSSVAERRPATAERWVRPPSAALMIHPLLDWPGGRVAQATDCNSVHAGSIPAPVFHPRESTPQRRLCEAATRVASEGELRLGAAPVASRLVRCGGCGSCPPPSTWLPRCCSGPVRRLVSCRPLTPEHRVRFPDGVLREGDAADGAAPVSKTGGASRLGVRLLRLPFGDDQPQRADTWCNCRATS